MDVKSILYITYDGLTDPLGQSQILPYLKGLAREGYRFTILSFEKPARFAKERALVERLTAESGIQWVPLSFSSRPPLLSKFYDAVRMKRKAVALHREQHFDMVHCRSYIAADVGLFLKRRFGVKFFFDMRGFWADEKKDGSWNVSNPVFRRVYAYYKKKEAQYMQHADQIISLTEAGRAEMMQWPSYNRNIPIDVIPCCADMQHFSLTDAGQKRQGRELLGIPQDAFVLSYLGSVGTWYMLDEMLRFFGLLRQRYPQAMALFLTHSDVAAIRKRIGEMGLQQEDFIIREASRKEVPLLIKASDVNISFIRPVYSKISSSPTKLGEMLSMGIPVICNAGVGDVGKIVTEADAGIVVEDFSDESFLKAIEGIPALLKKSPEGIRTAVENTYSLDRGIALYSDCYHKLLA